VMINDHSQIVFHAQNTSGGFGMYELTMDYSGDAPVVAGVRTIVQQGDALPGGRTVDSIRRGVSNAEGSFAAVIQTEETPSVYLQRKNEPFEPIIEFLDPAPNGRGQYGAAFGDIDLHDDDDLLVVSHFIDNDEDAEIGLFHLPGAKDSDQGELILQTGDLIPQSETPIVNIGLVDLDDEGQYVAQLEGHIPRRKGRANPPSNGPKGPSVPRGNGKGKHESVSALVRGNVRASVAHASTIAASRRMVRAAAPMRGDCIFGPRVGDGDSACTIHRTDKIQVLTLNDRPITRSNARSPLGALIRGISAPVLGANGIVFYLLITQVGLELCMSNGQEERTILARGDRIEGLPVNVILHAFHSDQADDQGRIVFTVEFEGRPNSLIVGIPV